MKRAPGTGTVQLHNGAWRLRLPRSLDPTRAWLSKSFPREQEAEAHAFMDQCLIIARKRVGERRKDEGLRFADVWPQYVDLVVHTAARRHGNSGAKACSRLKGMGSNWLAHSPFWQREIITIRGQELTEWLLEIQLKGKNAKGRPLSDSWVAQCAAAIRGTFRHLKLPVPDFSVDIDHQKVDSALTLQLQERFFQEVVPDPLDKVMAGCQMGAGLRVGELISLTIDRIDLGEAPHLMVTTGGPNGAPTKSGRPRRVELFEPGLGFFRMAMEHHHRPNDRGLLFAGPQGGYLKDWGERFVDWSATFGSHVTTHDLRHSYALAMLSGLWGYPPMHITFVSQQLGHADIRTTQKAYGHWDPGTGLVTARFLRGETTAVSEPVTAERLLGIRSPLRSPHRGLLMPKTPSNVESGVSDGN